MAVTATKVNGQFQFSGRAINITQAKNKALEPYNCIVHDYGITLELLPDDAQKRALAQQIGNARFMRNHYHDRDVNAKDNIFACGIKDLQTAGVTILP